MGGELTKAQMLKVLAAGGVVYWRGRTIHKAEHVPEDTPVMTTRYYFGQRGPGEMGWKWERLAEGTFAEAYAA